MLDKLAGIAARYEEIERQLGDPNVASNYSKVAEYAQERSDIQPIVEGYHRYKAMLEQITEAESLMYSDDDELRALARDEMDRLVPERESLEAELRNMLLPKDPRDDKNVIIEVRAGAGGDEAGIFAADLFRMYSRYAEMQNWKVELIDIHETGVGGFKEVVATIKGKGAYSRLKYESGVHRVQRVPATESQGRIHTSTATVAVLAEVDEVDIKIEDKDLDIQSYRAGGAGGQHMQKNDTAIRITHKPSGMQVTCQDERSKTQNLLRAMAVLRARLYEIELEKVTSVQEEARRSQIGSGDRAEKIRTYNYPQNRVTDHRVNVTSYSLDRFVNGEIDDIVDELATREQADKLQQASL